MRSIFFTLAVLIAGWRQPLAAQSPPFTFTPNSATKTFTYSDGQRSFSGVFVKPAGDGPFPAVIINHGQGGTPASYALPKANEMAAWGLVCIGPEMTHAAGGDTSPQGSGCAPENLARGQACVAALASLGYVDMTKVAIWGHSKGAYATIGQLGILGTQIRAAGFSAGGSVPDSFGENQAAPIATEAQGITAPTIMFHGTTDGTVPPSYSTNFKAILDGKGVVNARHTYDTSALEGPLTHNLHQTPAFNGDMLAKFQEWLVTRGVLPGAPPPPGANHRPAISWIADQRAAPGSAVGPLAFTISDAESAASSLTVTATSSNETLFPASSIALQGSGANRSILLTPAAGQSGTATITITAQDEGGKSTAISFTVTIAAPVPNNTPPVIQSVPDATLPGGAAYGPLSLVVKDTESAESALTLAASSSNPALVPVSAITFGGQNWGRTLTVTPTVNQTGRAVITLTVSDGANTSSTSFVIDVVSGDTPPAITGLPSAVTAEFGSAGITVPFTVSDAEMSAGDLQVTAASSNAALLPAANLVLSGTGASRSLAITPSPGVTGAATISLFVADAEFVRRFEFLFVCVNSAGDEAQFSRPRGIFVLDGGGPANYTTTFGKLISLRDGNIRNLPFVAGFTLRLAWSDVEGGLGQYDFHIIKNALSKLPAGQKLSLIIVPQDPAYIASTPGVATWDDDGLTRALPWDPFLRARRRAFLDALAAFEVDGIPLSRHPKLDVLDPYLPGGFTGIRDPNSTRLRDLSGYTRQKFLEAVQDELRALQDRFPGKFVQIGFWPIVDNENAGHGGTTAWEWIRQQLLAEFDGVTRPRVGFFMENLAARRAGAGLDPYTATPVTGFASALFASRGETWNGFQMLGSWTRPFNDGHVNNTLNGTPNDAIEFAFNVYGAEYHEVYSGDIDMVAFHPAFQRWHDFYASTATTNPRSDEDGDGLPLNWEAAHGLDPRQNNETHGANGDPDADGATNLLEFAFAQNPVAYSARYLPTLEMSAGSPGILLSYLRRIDAPHLLYTVEASPDLRAWAPATVAPHGPAQPSGDGVTELVTVLVDHPAENQAKHFFRVSVSTLAP